MTKLYLIRHGEAEGNLYRRSQGHYNANITPLGRRQIAALAERFRDVKLDALWSSDLYRTQTTAGAILKYHPDLPLNLSERLREIDVGVWEDVAWGNIAAEYPEQMEYFTHDPERWSVPGGEPYKAVQARMKAAVLELGARYDGGAVAVVSHGLAIRALLCDIFGIASADIDTLPYGDNTSVTCLSVEKGAITVDYYNDNSHLTAAGLSTFARQTFRKDLEQKVPAGKIYTRFEPVDMERDRDLYLRCYGATWEASHGSREGFVPSIYLRAAEHHAKHDPRTLMKLYSGDTFAGLIELDPERGADNGAGWISLLYIEPALRGRRLGIQLVGHGVSYFRRAGRDSIRLHVAEENGNARGFYEHSGFRTIGTDRGAVGNLCLMELDITRRVIPPEEL